MEIDAANGGALSGRVSPKHSQQAALGIANRGPSPLQNPATGLRIDTNVHGYAHDANSVMEEDDSPLEDSPDEGDGQDQFSDELSSSSSVPDEDIDFEHVYALHTFLATVEGQASVSKGDSLVLLDDANSYWWLVRVLKTTLVGYIPAENIETPFERLARLNKHRNVDLTIVTQEDHLNGPGSASAVNLIVPPVHPNKEGKMRSPKLPRFAAAGSKSVQFTAPTYHEHSGNEYSDEEYDEEYSLEDGQHEADDQNDILDEDELMQHGHRGSAGFESDEESDEASADDEAEPSPLQEPQKTDSGDRRGLQQRPLQNITNEPVRAATPPVGKSVDELLQEQTRQYQPQIAQHAQQSAASLGRTQSNGSTHARDAGQAQVGRTRSLSGASSAPRESADSANFDPLGNAGSGTRKITLTPQIAQESGATPSSSQNTLVDTSPTLQISREPSSKPLVHNQRSLSQSSTISQTPSSASGSSYQAPSLDENLEPSQSKSAGKKKKSSGMFGGLFKKKDKRSSEIESSNRNAGPSGRPGAFSPTPVSSNKSISMHTDDARPREWKDHDSSLAEEAHKRQQVEAKQAMQKNYGIQRQPGENTNTFTPTNSNLSPPTQSRGSNASGKARPGSLIGSPGVPGLAVPTLNVLRVFADESVQAEATFKTVLLSEMTTTPELLKQAMQRFRLPIEHASDFFLTIKEAAGQEEMLQPTDKPLTIIQTLSEALSGITLPSVKRSSVSSISSVASNLSMHPAIEKLNMSDFSDDHAVKLFLHRRSSPNPQQFDDAGTASQRSSALTVTPADLRLGAPRESVTLHSPSMKFALRVVIQPVDLPDSLVFDPSSQAVIPKQALTERRPSAALAVSPMTVPNESLREKLLFFPANAVVSEVVESALDQFGILGGVVDGGDNVEEKASKRRSMMRVRYALAMLDHFGHETRLQPNKRIIEAYSQPPQFKQQPSSKDARRRSLDWSTLVATAHDIQQTDPIFVLRNVYRSPLPSPEPARMADRPSARREASTDTSRSVYATPSEELPPTIAAQLPMANRQGAIVQKMESAQVPNKHQVIAQQRAASRANQRAMLTAHRNTSQGVDILLEDKTTIRSSRSFTGAPGKVRYSYIDQDGAEFDISDIVEAEWSQAPDAEPRSASSASFSGSSYKSAPTSPLSANSAETVRRSRSDDQDADDQAINAVRDLNLTIGGSDSRAATPLAGDLLHEAVQKEKSSRNASRSETLETRLDRVLNKIKAGDSRPSNIASTLRKQTSKQALQATADGRSSPANVPSGRRSPAAVNTSAISNPTGRHTPVNRGLQHAKETSIASQSDASSAYSPSTPATMQSLPTTSAGNSPATRATSTMSSRLVYPADFGVETLLAIVGSGRPPYRNRPVRLLQPGLEELFGPAEMPELKTPHFQKLHAESMANIAGLESKLDNLLAQFNQDMHATA